MLIAIASTGCSKTAPTAPSPPVPLALESQAKLFSKGVEKVTDGVYVAIGYGLANSILIEGDDGVIIVDALEGRSQAEEVKAAFEQVVAKPVRAVILTHNHADHVFGSSVFTGGDASIPVYAHESTSELIDKVVSVVRDGLYTRSMRMFGQYLPHDQLSSNAIGMRLDYHAENIALARPTITFSDALEITVSGVNLRLIHAPGETPDQIVVWLPEKKVLLPADNIYQAFPNLYTIRGTEYRDVMHWVNSIDIMRELGAEYLVPSHTRPLVGKDTIDETLTAYRDAIQYVHDQTIRGFNLGKTPDELAHTITLPPHLASHPWLGEYYGTVAWSVRGIYDGYVGWFNGDASSLHPMAPEGRAKRFATSLTLNMPLSEQAKKAVAEKDYQWGAELSRMWMLLESDSSAARETLAACLEALGAAQENAPARNYYLTQAAELRGALTIPPPDAAAVPDEFLDSLPIDAFMAAMRVRLNPERARDIDSVLQFTFTDSGENIAIHVRRGVAEIRKRTAQDPDAHITTTTVTWKRIVSKKLNPAVAYATNAIQLEGGISPVIDFLGLFDR